MDSSDQRVVGDMPRSLRPRQIQFTLPARDEHGAPTRRSTDGQDIPDDSQPKDDSPRDDDSSDDDDSFNLEFWTEFEPRRHKFDIVDFRTPTSRANLANFYPKTPRQEVAQYRIFLALSVLLGVLVAIVGFLIEQGVRGVSWLIYTPTLRFIHATPDQFYAGAAIFLVLCTFFVAMASALVVFVSPLAAGSGIPEIKSYLNGVVIPGLVKLRTLIAKAVGITFSIGGGLVCGKEGPMIHCGGILGSALSQMASRAFRWRANFAWLTPFRSRAMKRDFTAIGSAAGVAVAFSSPLGGTLFAIEEAATHWSQPLSWATITAAGMSAFVGAVLTQFAHGHFLVELSGTGVFQGPGSKTDFVISDMPFYILIAVAGGLLGALLTRLQKSLTLFRFKSIASPSKRLTEAVAIGLLTAFLRLLIPRAAGSCRPLTEDVETAVGEEKFESFQGRFDCPDGEYNNYAALIFQPMEIAVRLLLHSEEAEEFHGWVLLVALVFFFVMTVITYGIGVPSGLFVPAFLIGTLLGRLVGFVVHFVWTSRTDFHIETFAFVGAVAGLAGFTRMTMSVAMIALETTSNGHAFIVAFLVAVIAKYTGDLFGVGIYDLHIHLKGVPLLETRMERADLYYGLKVRDVMSGAVVAVYAKSRVGDLVDVLRTYSYGSFPVVRPIDGYVERPSAFKRSKSDPNFQRLKKEEQALAKHYMEYALEHNESGSGPGLCDFSTHSLRGMLDRITILAILKNLESVENNGSNQFLPRKFYDTAWPNQNLTKREAAILNSLSEDDMDRVIDLGPYTDPNPVTITESATVAEARTLLRTSGVRHALAVHIKSGTVVGILTRKDILESTLEEVEESRLARGASERTV